MRTRGLAYIYAMLQQDEDYTKTLEEERELLAQQQHLIDEKIIEQQLIFEQLQDSLLSWKAALQKKHAITQERNNKIKQQIVSNLQTRQTKLAALYLQEQAIPQACKQATQILTEKFSSPQAGRLFLSALCNQIEREKL